MAYQPSISIIIAVKNAKDYLAQTLASLQLVDYQPLEVIVIDGASTDGIQSVINTFSKIITRYQSELDDGIADAFNKGLSLATGDYINFQGAGDLLMPGTAIKALFAELDESHQLICGQVLRVKEDGSTPVWLAPKKASFSPRSLLFKMALPHQALFTRRDFFDVYGNFDRQIRFAMDYELLLRAYKKFPKTVVKKILISRWREGGIGSQRITDIFAEYHRIKVKHQLANKLVLSAIDKFTRLKYWLKIKLRVAY